MADKYSVSTGGQMANAASINDSRRMYNFGERVAELAPQQSPFFVYLSKVAKKPTDDPVFKFLEQRHQWQRRNFEIKTAKADQNLNSSTTITDLRVTCKYDKYGNTQTADTLPEFMTVGDTISITTTDGPNTVTGIVTAFGTAGADYVSLTVTAIAVNGNTTLSSFTDIDFADGDSGQVIGSAFAEGTGAPEGWKDEMYDREGYCQIFKTAISLFSGTSMATRYRGIADEYKRVWQEKLMEHKMDIEHAMLFGVGKADESGSGPKRYSWGMLPYATSNGTNSTFTYADSAYDNILDYLETMFAPESGNSGDKLVLCSRKILAWLNKLGSDSFLQNTVGANTQYSLDVTSIPGQFGHNVTKVSTIFGNLHFVQEPLLRNQWENKAILIDMKNVAYRPLVGNGKSRDTHIITNVQGNDTDGRKDMILTEAGLEVSLPETHGVMTFS
tara:strand:- start:5819 stop:7150 length:1332 start_codon:yes stop_codon:yes gene_type:complete